CLRADARLWMRRAAEFLSARLSKSAQASEVRALKERMERLASRHELIVERLAALPATLIHGEFYASNVLVRESGGGLHVCPVDWERAGLGPGLLDLAALIAGKWTDEQKRALALEYYAALPPPSPPTPLPPGGERGAFSSPLSSHAHERAVSSPLS